MTGGPAGREPVQDPARRPSRRKIAGERFVISLGAACLACERWSPAMYLFGLDAEPVFAIDRDATRRILLHRPRRKPPGPVPKRTCLRAPRKVGPDYPSPRRRVSGYAGLSTSSFGQSKMDPQILIKAAAREEHAEVGHFYRSVGYGGEIQEADRVMVARRRTSVVGAVRLCEEEGELVLRGMYVEPESRGRGVGRGLLAAVERLIGERRCWCVPYWHLTGLYGAFGFRVSAFETVPSFLQLRYEAYVKRGLEVVVMVRQARAVAGLPNPGLHPAGGAR